jgi:hypothetical protein
MTARPKPKPETPELYIIEATHTAATATGKRITLTLFKWMNTDMNCRLSKV